MCFDDVFRRRGNVETFATDPHRESNGMESAANVTEVVLRTRRSVVAFLGLWSLSAPLRGRSVHAVEISSNLKCELAWGKGDAEVQGRGRLVVIKLLYLIRRGGTAVTTRYH